MDPHKARILKDFSEWLREAKEDHGGTQADFARAIGVTQEQVSRWINGRFSPTLLTMRDVARRLKRPLPPSLIGHETQPSLPFEVLGKRYVSLRREARQIAAGEPIDDPETDDGAAAYAFSLPRRVFAQASPCAWVKRAIPDSVRAAGSRRPRLIASRTFSTDSSAIRATTEVVMSLCCSICLPDPFSGKQWSPRVGTFIGNVPRGGSDFFRYPIHVTLNTGHSRVSPRSEVSDDVIAALRPVVRAGGGMLPGPPGYRLVLTREGRNAAYTIHRVDDGGAVAPLVTCIVSQTPGVWGAVWPRVTKGVRTRRPLVEPALPWLAVDIHPTVALDNASMEWLGDLERCVAWTIIEDQP